MQITWRPLVWVGPQTPPFQRRSRWTFRADWNDTLKLLKHEVGLLDGTELVVEADYREGDLRVDGQPRVNARGPVFPGIRLSFNMPGVGRVEYQTDTYEDWRHNVRAIALSLQALRAVDRYGVTNHSQQYTGFKAVGAGATPLSSGRMSRHDAAQFLAKYGTVGGIVPTTETFVRKLEGDAEMAARYYKQAAKRLHPDLPNGSAELFKRLQDAREALTLL